MSAITTLKGHVSRAEDFYNKQGKFFVIGKTSSWSDDINPPVPTTSDEIQEVAGYKLAETTYYVVPDETGELTYLNKRWKIVQPSEIYDKGARWVYITTYISYSELPTNISYRQVGLVSKLVKAAGVPSGASALLPAQVANPGILEVLDNRTPVYREADQREQLVIIIEF